MCNKHGDRFSAPFLCGGGGGGGSGGWGGIFSTFFFIELLRQYFLDCLSNVLMQDTHTCLKRVGSCSELKQACCLACQDSFVV